MGAYEIIVKTEEMRRKAQEGDFISAQKILDTMDLKKVKNISDLSLMAEVYTKNARFEECNEILLRIYEKTRTRKIIFQLMNNALDRVDLEDCQLYFEEYQEIAPKDFYIHIFRYLIGKLKSEPYETLRQPLEELKKTEYIEQWAYELAKLYYKAGMEKECLRECSDIILWFGEGMYVEKAKVLKAYYSGEMDKDKIITDLKNRANQTTKSNVVKVEDYIQEKDGSNHTMEDSIAPNILEMENNQEKLNQEKLNQEKLNQEKLNQEELNQEKLNQEKLNQEKLNQEELNQDELKQEELKQKELKQEKITQEKNVQEQNITENNTMDSETQKDKISGGTSEEMLENEKDENYILEKTKAKDTEKDLVVEETKNESQITKSETELIEEEVERALYRLLEEEQIL